MLSEVALPAPIDADASKFLQEKQALLSRLKDNLAQAQSRMKKYADKQRSERSFSVGDMVYLKLQPYRLTAFGILNSLKLISKYYGPFRILEKIGSLAYKLQLPSTVSIHPVFHVSQLKKHYGANAVPSPDLPMVGPDGKMQTEPVVKSCKPDLCLVTKF